MNLIKPSAPLLAALALGISAQVPADDDGGKGSRHVLLISIDGMHALDYENCVADNTCPAKVGSTVP